MGTQEILITIVVLVYVAGFVAAFFALFQARTPEGSAAWVLALIAFPFISLPIFITFGKRRLKLYSKLDMKSFYPDMNGDLSKHYCQSGYPLELFFSRSEHPFIGGNELTVLEDGKEIFEDMLKQIETAEKYILLQMYIIRPDHIGKVFAEALARKAAAGVKVYVLYENFTIKMSDDIIKLWEETGVTHGRYNPGKKSTFYVNFRNHRKILIIDGKLAYGGGINIGDDYLGLYPEIGDWRDTNVRLRGPAIMVSQKIFAKDWLWSQNTLLDIEWKVPEPAGDAAVVIVNSDPGDERATNLLQHIEIINSANKRIWIANPYIVPPQGIIDALLIARLKNVEVRILVPGICDNKLLTWAGEVYLERLLKHGIRIFKYPTGMMHQKVLLSDDSAAMIGSSNLDFRSMYINFENAIMSYHPQFVEDVATMLKKDFAKAHEVKLEELKLRPLNQKFKAYFSNLLAPLL